MDSENSNRARGTVLAVACGGGACRTLEGNESRLGYPLMKINTDGRSVTYSRNSGDPGTRGDMVLASGIVRENSEDLKKVFRNYRTVLLFLMAGGGTGTGMAPVILEAARECGCRTVVIMGLPLKFEDRRRGDMKEYIEGISAFADRMFLSDEQTMLMMNPDTEARWVFTRMANSLFFAVKSIADLLGGPFYTTFPHKTYTFVYESDANPASAAEKMVSFAVGNMDGYSGRIVVAVGSDFSDIESRAVTDKIAGISGILPDIIHREDAEGSRFLAFFSLWESDFTSFPILYHI